MASIIVMNGPKEGDNYLLCRGTTVIGRDESNPIQIIDSHISRKHMQIRFNAKDESYSVVDMSSTHGTFINRFPIKDETVLNNNDLITVGKTDVLFTSNEFKNQEDAREYRKKVGQKVKDTLVRGTTAHLKNKSSHTD